jgi:hypothetical protein
MADHILLQLALRRPHLEVPNLPSDAVYDAVTGCWQGGDGQAFAPATTKKQDIETGEDQKGQ